ncbi:sterol desaturase family protein [Psychroserpens sp.]|uniref:sterol desaturase family protein n=1 Tax=Psychroserpens sp. TaxID=2020870 RepID=UPI001B1E5EDA|nr:sterol desaturase family protein [Psychroserpens sp.]MBO6606157.1 sterol desaturase family protein [Psychroserpens sp.]MBO6631933.1 sterol desaturase family protein [Psychroserpens sp.]MBO6652471.1 sterol desaturase family protein [Psychroserpens sp.]MBO6681757.1 sterol desaturase family protein [Psychroserpens sp.]MBO6749532.1 sterol desaturase family protein [Psychroserpens sp.]
MQEIINYFETIPSLHRSLILVGGITFFWLLEGSLPLFNFTYKKWKHAIPNFFFTLTTIIINFGLAFLLVASADWVKETQFGIINWIPNLPLWAYVFLGVLLLDFIGAYLAHYVEHKVKPLWMIHLVHHTDHNVDTTTANRHHPLESVIRFVFTLAGVFIVGTPIAIVMLYQSLSLVATQFSHANIKLPRRVDSALSYVIVSPDMHKVHHHYVLPYTDSNYGNIFSIWDRIFGTFMTLERDAIVYGVDTFPDEEKNSNIKDLLKQPFHKYRKPTTINVED